MPSHAQHHHLHGRHNGTHHNHAAEHIHNATHALLSNFSGSYGSIVSSTSASGLSDPLAVRTVHQQVNEWDRGPKTHAWVYAVSLGLFVVLLYALYICHQHRFSVTIVKVADGSGGSSNDSNRSTHSVAEATFPLVRRVRRWWSANVLQKKEEMDEVDDGAGEPMLDSVDASGSGSSSAGGDGGSETRGFLLPLFLDCTSSKQGRAVAGSTSGASGCAAPKRHQQSKVMARAILVLCAALYGSNFVGTKYIQRSLRPSITTTLRFFIGAGVFFPHMWRHYTNSYPRRKGGGFSSGSGGIWGAWEKRMVLSAMEIGFWSAVGFNVQGITLQFTSASKNAFLSSLSVVIVPILDIVVEAIWGSSSGGNSGSSNSSGAGAVILLRDNAGAPNSPSAAGATVGSPTAGAAGKLDGEGVTSSGPDSVVSSSPSGPSNNSTASSSTSNTGLRSALLENKRLVVLVPSILAIGGVAVLEIGGLEQPQFGDLLVCVVPMAYAMCFWRSEQLSEHHPHLRDTLTITGIILSTTGVLSLLWTCSVGDFPTISVVPGQEDYTIWHLVSVLCSWPIALSLMYTGLMTTAWTSLMEQKAIKVLSAGEVTVIYTLEPLFATVFSHFLLGEEAGLHTAMGAVFIIAACLWKPVLMPQLADALRRYRNWQGYM